jgi:hypothetical protein
MSFIALQSLPSSLSSLPSDAAPWSIDWLWGCPLIVITLLVHASALGRITRAATRRYARATHRDTSLAIGALSLGAVSILATILHGLEAGAWALTYCLLGALPNYKSAMLYSLGAMTTYGKETFHLEPHWEMLGSIEALNGWLLFGLSTAFLFALIQSFWSAHPSDPRH